MKYKSSVICYKMIPRLEFYYKKRVIKYEQMQCAFLFGEIS